MHKRQAGENFENMGGVRLNQRLLVKIKETEIRIKFLEIPLSFQSIM